MRLFCKLSSSGSFDLYHFGGTRSILSWETIVHYPRYKLRGQIRLKDTTLSLGSGQHSHLFVFVLLLQVCFFCFWFLNEHRNNTLKTNLCCVRLQIFSFTNFCSVHLLSFFTSILLLFVTAFCFCFRFERTVRANYWLKFFFVCFWFSFERTVGASVRFR